MRGKREGTWVARAALTPALSRGERVEEGEGSLPAVSPLPHWGRVRVGASPPPGCGVASPVVVGELAFFASAAAPTPALPQWGREEFGEVEVGATVGVPSGISPLPLWGRVRVGASPVVVGELAFVSSAVALTPALSPREREEDGEAVGASTTATTLTPLPVTWLDNTIASAPRCSRTRRRASRLVGASNVWGVLNLGLRWCW